MAPENSAVEETTTEQQGETSPHQAPTPARPVHVQPTRERRKNAGDVDNVFDYHAPTGDQQHRYNEIRAHARVMARMLKLNCLESRELSLALTNLQQASMWGCAAIAINEYPQAADETTEEPETVSGR